MASFRASSVPSPAPEPRKGEVRHVVYSSINELPRSDWDRLWPNVDESYDYYRTVEVSNLEGFTCRYIVVYDHGNAALIAPVFWSDLDLALGVEGMAKRAILAGRRLYPRLMIERTLFCGSPFGENGAIGITADTESHAALLTALIHAMDTVCGEQRLQFIMFKDFPAAGPVDLAPLLDRGFLRGESYPNVIVHLPFKTTEEYLGSLSYNARKDLRRKLRQTSAAGEISVRVLNDVADVIDEIYALYLNSYNAGTVRFEKLTRDYFLAVGTYMRDKARFFYFTKQATWCVSISALLWKAG